MLRPAHAEGLPHSGPISLAKNRPKNCVPNTGQADLNSVKTAVRVANAKKYELPMNAHSPSNDWLIQGMDAACAPVLNTGIRPCAASCFECVSLSASVSSSVVSSVLGLQS